MTLSEEGYWCRKCEKFVIKSPATFQHIHLGEKLCFICPEDRTMVYLRRRGKEPA